MDKVFADAADIQHLAPQGQLEVPLTPDTVVLCIHRGRRTTIDGERVHHPDAARYANMDRERYFVGDYKDTYDGRHYVIAPGYFRTTYGAALHFQKRAVVPGSRNPETNYQASFIAIIGIADVSPSGGLEVVRPIDDKAQWAPFTDEECGVYEVAGDALDRESMTNPIEREVTVKSVNEAITGRPATASRVRGGGGPARGRRGTQVEATDPAILTPIPPEENRVLQEAKAAAAERGSED
jgi:hypothetical protein